MYTNLFQWADIRDRITKGVDTIRGVARKEGISRATIRKMMREDAPKRYARKPARKKVDDHVPRIEALLIENELLSRTEKMSLTEIYHILRNNHGYSGSYSSVRRYCRTISLPTTVFEVLPTFKVGSIQSLTISRTPKTYVLDAITDHSRNTALQLRRDHRAERRAEVGKWIDDLRGDRLAAFPGGEPKVVDRLMKLVRDACQRQRNQAIAALAHDQGFSIRQIAVELGIARNTCRRYLRAYYKGGVDGLIKRATAPCKASNDDLKDAVFRVLHEPPADHGINRSSWIMRDLRSVLAGQGHQVGLGVLRQIIHDAGWKWRKARIVLTSQDPAYREKLAAVQTILSNLTSDQAFFSIDEFGPFAVKMKQGLMLDPPGRHRVVPQWQKSKGCMIMTAALELSANQITHFYSERKNTTEMIRMMDILLELYADRRTLFLSWDAASWHVSKKLIHRIDEHNLSAEMEGKPRVEIAPLPAGAQFLNVIESVFSGMARAVLHNSNYASADEARAAIDGYFNQRNEQFRANPKRAGKRIWGHERVPPTFSDSNNCKDAKWR